MEPNTVFDLNWSGMLTIDNLSKVSKLLQELLEGKKFTFVCSKQLNKFKPVVSTSQKLELDSNNEIWHFWTGFDTNRGVIEFHTTDWACRLNTNIKEDAPTDKPENTFLKFTSDQVIITVVDVDVETIYYNLALEK